MASWQRRARWAFGAFAATFAVALFFLVGEREAPVASAPVERLDPAATVETRGGDVVQLKGARQDVRIEFAGQATYADGTSKLLGVRATIENRAGRSFVVTGDEGRLGADQSAIELTGNVSLEASDGLTARAASASYTEAEGIVRAPGPVTFQRGRMSGSGVGFTYDRQRDTVWLLESAAITIAPEGEAGGMEVTAGAAGLARTDRYMRFEREVRLVRDGQVVEAGEATVHLLPDRDEPSRIELRGESSITGAAGTGSLESMSARDINLHYAEDGRTLQQAVLAGHASIALAPGGGGQQLAAEYIDLTLAPDGAVTALASRERVQMTLPAARGAAARTIRATELTGAGEAGRGLSALRFAGGVEFRETGRGPARIGRARTLDVGLGREAGAVEEARFAGDFRFEEGARRASSATARYDPVQGTLALDSPADGPPPRLSDTRAAIEAARIGVTLGSGAIDAEGRVRSVLQPGRAKDGARGPSILREEDPVNVTAARLVADGDGVATYEGKARLWQGETTVQGETIVLDEAKGDLTATGGALTVLPIGGGGDRPATARGETFRFDEAARRATWTTKAQFIGAQGTLTADRVEVVLAADDNALERLEGHANVSVTLDTRTATGARLTYTPAEERYVMAGTPVKLVEECRETTGKTLTFFRASDRILIDGNEETRTQTKGGSKCPEPRIE